jgi:hypothetical protein
LRIYADPIDVGLHAPHLASGLRLIAAVKDGRHVRPPCDAECNAAAARIATA